MKQPALFRRFITRFGQLPLLVLLWLLVCVLAAHMGHMYSWDMQLLDWSGTIDAKTAAGMIGGFSFLSVSFLSGFSLFLSFALGTVIKSLYHKPRPQPMSYTTWWQKLDAGSFPSIHTANSVIIAFWGTIAASGFLAASSCTYDPSIYPCPTPWLYSASSVVLRYVFFIMIACGISYSRVTLRKHYWVDIIGGVVFAGIIIGGVVFFSPYIVTIFHSVVHAVFYTTST